MTITLPDGTKKKQGCVHEGDDYRHFGWLFCPIQRWLSWRVERHWRLFLVLDVGRFRTGVHFPPFWYATIPVENRLFTITWRGKRLSWLNIRIGWRFDGNWKRDDGTGGGGYIFEPSAMKFTKDGAGPITYDDFPKP